MDNGFIVLSRDFFIGKGINMAVYINPMNPSQCIKIRIREIRDYYLKWVIENQDNEESFRNRRLW